ncbi:MAG: hypothetical protein ACE5G7_03555 [Candidatus Hydrothermarchaeaceae archaeon]
MVVETLEELEEELGLDGLSGVQIDDVLEALRVVYIGQEKTGTIGTPMVDVEDLYKSKLDILMEKELVYTVPHTGVWDYGYRCTDPGTRMGSELMRRHIEENEKALTRLLESYPKKLLTWWIDTYFTETDTGHLSSHVTQLSFKWIAKELIQALDALELSEGLRRKLVNMGVAVETFKRQETVIPPEVAEFIRRFTTAIDEEENLYGVYRALKDYGDQRLVYRNELVDKLSLYGYTEEKLIELVTETGELGLTSPYTDYSQVDDPKVRPFEILDYNGFNLFLDERFAVPFKESLLEETT